MKYVLINNQGNESITVFHDGELYAATNEHPQFARIKELAEAGVDASEVVDLFSPARTIEIAFKQLSEQVVVRNGVVLFDNEPVEDSISEQILRVLNDEADFAPIVRFLEKVQSNPSEESRAHLYRWLASEKFTITPDGDIIGYKGVDHDNRATQTGYAIVNGEVFERVRPLNLPGSVVEMPRSMVTADPSLHCSVGLHVGTWGYAGNFAQKRITVVVNPRDVVSVPSDSSGQKMRVCRYKVLDDNVTAKIEAPVQYFSAAVSFEDDDDLCGDCGEYTDECTCF